METDRFSQWMEVELIDVKRGYSKISMQVREEMVNAFGIAHGGISFALADTAFAFACNSDGLVAVALDVSVSFPNPVFAGNKLVAEAKKISETKRTGLYLVEVRNERDALVVLFKGTCFRTEKPLP